MSQKQKLAERLLTRPKDFTWDDRSAVLRHLGYTEGKTGKTSGSRRRFIHPTAALILLHKPHPGNIVKMYTLNQVIETLKQEHLL